MSDLPRTLVADYAPTRMGVRLALQGLVTICAEMEDADAALESALAERPDLCLIGQSIPGGLELVRMIAEALPETVIVFLAGGAGVNDLLIALRGGANGYVPAGFQPEQLRRAVVAALDREAAIPRSMVRELIDELRALGRAADDRLSGREAQILALLRQGHSTSAIASRLAISPVTVRRHISKLVHKAGVADRRGLLDAAAGAGSPGPAAQH